MDPLGPSTLGPSTLGPSTLDPPTLGPETPETPEPAADSLLNYGLTSPETIAMLQRRANDRADADVRRSSVATMTYQSAVRDAYDALVGITADLAGNTPRKSLGDILGHGDRLRGLGVLLIALALVGAVVDYLMHPVFA